MPGGCHLAEGPAVARPRVVVSSEGCWAGGAGRCGGIAAPGLEGTSPNLEAAIPGWEGGNLGLASGRAGWGALELEVGCPLWMVARPRWGVVSCLWEVGLAKAAVVPQRGLGAPKREVAGVVLGAGPLRLGEESRLWLVAPPY